MKICFATQRPAVADQEANMRTVEAQLEATEADLVLFGELFLPGYMAKDELPRLAFDEKSAWMGRIQDAAKTHDTNVVFGYARADPKRPGVIYDSAGLVTRNGKVDWYDKWYLANFGPFEEKLFFDEGERLRLWKIDGVLVGPQICYDLFFPELTKAYALMGAQLLINISASPNVSRTFFEQLFPARTLETGCFMAYCNVAGTQEDLVFWGGSQLWGPRGDLKIKSPYYDPSVIEYDVDLQEVALARPFRPTARDTRKQMVAVLQKAVRGVGR